MFIDGAGAEERESKRCANHQAMHGMKPSPPVLPTECVVEEVSTEATAKPSSPSKAEDMPKQRHGVSDPHEPGTLRHALMRCRGEGYERPRESGV